MDRGRPCDVVTLRIVDAVLLQKELGVVALDAFGDRLLVQASGDRDE